MRKVEERKRKKIGRSEVEGTIRNAGSRGKREMRVLSLVVTRVPWYGYLYVVFSSGRDKYSIEGQDSCLTWSLVGSWGQRAFTKQPINT